MRIKHLNAIPRLKDLWQMIDRGEIEFHEGLQLGIPNIDHGNHWLDIQT